MTAPSEVDWVRLFDEDLLTANRDRAEKKYRDFTTQQINGLRRLAKHDLMFLASGPLEYELLSPDLHGHYTSWLKRVQGERYRMSLLPRDHYKSTTNTIADSVQMALPGGEDLPHPYCLGPNIKLLLGHENRESASRFLFEITQAFRAKPLMLALFPELIPSPRVQRMNKWELELPRDVYDKEPTFDTIGVGGAAQGRHYHWLKLDDLFGEAARDSETVMKTVLLWFDNVYSLLTRPRYDGWDLTGTRWAPTDVYSHALKMYGCRMERSVLRAYDTRDIEGMFAGQLAIYARGALENGAPIFPEEFLLEDLNRLRRSPRIWAAQYANNPRSGEMTELNPGWLKFYNVGSQDRLIIFEGESSRTVRTSQLDRCIMVDPATGDNAGTDPSGFIVTGTDKRMNIYVLEAFKKRLKPPELIDELLRLYLKWNPRLVSIEAVAFSITYRYWFEQKCQELGIYPSMYDYKRAGRKSKPDYIRGLSNYGAGGQIYILEGMHELRDEWEWFPLSDEDHLLDALSQGPEVWAPSLVEANEDVQRAVQVVNDDRDALTGY